MTPPPGPATESPPSLLATGRHGIHRDSKSAMPLERIVSAQDERYYDVGASSHFRDVDSDTPCVPDATLRIEDCRLHTHLARDLAWKSPGHGLHRLLGRLSLGRLGIDPSPHFTNMHFDGARLPWPPSQHAFCIGDHAGGMFARFDSAGQQQTGGRGEGGGEARGGPVRGGLTRSPPGREECVPGHGATRRHTRPVCVPCARSPGLACPGREACNSMRQSKKGRECNWEGAVSVAGPRHSMRRPLVVLGVGPR